MRLTSCAFHMNGPQSLACRRSRTTRYMLSNALRSEQGLSSTLWSGTTSRFQFFFPVHMLVE